MPPSTYRPSRNDKNPADIFTSFSKRYVVNAPLLRSLFRLSVCLSACCARVLYTAGQRSSAVNGPAIIMESSATSTPVTGPVRERLQAGTESAPVLDCSAPLRRFHSAGYKYPDLLTYK